MKRFTFKFECPSILGLVVQELICEKKFKFVQFVLIYHLMFKGQPMIMFACLEDLFMVVKVKRTLKKTLK